MSPLEIQQQPQEKGCLMVMADPTDLGHGNNHTDQRSKKPPDGPDEEKTTARRLSPLTLAGWSWANMPCTTLGKCVVYFTLILNVHSSSLDGCLLGPTYKNPVVCLVLNVHGKQGWSSGWLALRLYDQKQFFIIRKTKPSHQPEH